MFHLMNELDVLTIQEPSKVETFPMLNFTLLGLKPSKLGLKNKKGAFMENGAINDDTNYINISVQNSFLNNGNRSVPWQILSFNL